jgi:hypothetical protein
LGLLVGFQVKISTLGRTSCRAEENQESVASWKKVYWALLDPIELTVLSSKVRTKNCQINPVTHSPLVTSANMVLYSSGGNSLKWSQEGIVNC